VARVPGILANEDAFIGTIEPELLVTQQTGWVIGIVLNQEMVPVLKKVFCTGDRLLARIARRRVLRILRFHVLREAMELKGIIFLNIQDGKKDLAPIFNQEVPQVGISVFFGGLQDLLFE